MVVIWIVLILIIIYWTYLVYKIAVWSCGDVPNMAEDLGTTAMVTMLPRIIFWWFKDSKYLSYDSNQVCTGGYNVLRGRKVWGRFYTSIIGDDMILDYNHPSNGWWVRGIKDHLRTDNGVVKGVLRWHRMPMAVFTLSGLALHKVRKTAGQAVISTGVPNENI